MTIIDTAELLKEFSEFFKQMSIIWLVLYPILWSLLIDGFYDIAYRMEGLLDNVFSFGGVLESDAVSTLYSYLAPISFTFVGVAIIIFGYQLITGKNAQRTNFLLNSVLAVGIIMLLPWMTIKLGEFSENIIDVSLESGVGEGEEVSSLSTQIVQNNTRDVVYLVENDFEEAENGVNNEITDDNIRDINWVEIVHPDPDDDNNARDFGVNEEDVFSEALVEDDETVDIEAFDLPIIGEIPFLNEFYYRWTGNFFNMYAQLGILVAVMLFTSFKVVRLFFEILFMKVIAPFVSAVDISTGQRMKQMLKDFVVNFAVVGLVFLVFQLFMLSMDYVNNLDVNPLVTSVIMFALGLAVIDGPDQAKKLLGIDIGVKDGYRQVMGALAVGTVASKATSGLRRHMGGEARDLKDNLKERFGKGDSQDADNKSRAAALKSSNDGSESYSVNDQLTKELDDKGFIQSSNKQSQVTDESSESDSRLNRGQLPNQGAEQSVSEDMKDEQRDVKENLIKDEEQLSNEEKEVLEKVMKDPESAKEMSDDERQVLENLRQSDSLTPDEKQALQSTGSIDTEATNQDVIGNMISAENSNLSDEEKQVLERLIQDPSQLDQDERQVLENLTQNDGLEPRQRQAIESIMSEQSDAQNRQVLEQAINSDDSNLSNQERQVLETLVNDPSALTPQERQVVENLQSNNQLDPQAQQAIQGMMQTIDSSDATQQDMPDLQQSRNIVENVISNDNVVSTGKRQVMEKMMQDPSQLTPAERNVVENISAQSELQPAERKAFENVISESQTTTPQERNVVQSLSQEGTQHHLPEATQAVKQIIDHSQIGYQEGEVLLKAVQQPGETLNTQERQVIEKVSSDHNIEPQHREVLEKVVSNTSNIEPQERQVFDKVMNSPSDVTQAERQVIDNVISNDNNNLTQQERTSIENVVQNHVPSHESTMSDQTQNVHRNVVDHENERSQSIKTETVNRDINTRNQTQGMDRLSEIKRKHEEINRNKRQ